MKKYRVSQKWYGILYEYTGNNKVTRTERIIDHFLKLIFQMVLEHLMISILFKFSKGNFSINRW